MSVLADELAAASVVELVDARRLVHRAVASRRRLGFASTSVLPDPEPRLFAALCVTIDAELARRRIPALMLGCPACRETLGLSTPSPAGDAPVPSTAAASELVATSGGH